MDIRLFLKEDFTEAFHQKAIPHVGKHAKTYVNIAQAIAMINDLIETPYFEECVQHMKAIDPSNSIDFEEVFCLQQCYLIDLHQLLQHFFDL